MIRIFDYFVFSIVRQQTALRIGCESNYELVNEWEGKLGKVKRAWK
jgi:hypothetical protein